MAIKMRVREHAEKRGLSIGKFSRQADINLSTARRLWYSTTDGVENSKKGSLERVDFEVLEKLCRFFGLPPGEFLELVDTAPNKERQAD